MTVPSPFAAAFAPTEVSPGGSRVVLVADEAQRAAIAEAADVIGVDAFRAEMEVKPWSGAGFHVTGRVTGRLRQACVVSLEPVETTVDETVDLKLVPPEDLEKYEVKPDESGEIDLVAFADQPDPIEDGVIDLGALAVEYFILGLEPYPRKEGASFDAVGAGVDEGREKSSPFAALARLGKE